MCVVPISVLTRCWCWTRCSWIQQTRICARPADTMHLIIITLQQSTEFWLNSSITSFRFGFFLAGDYQACMAMGLMCSPAEAWRCTVQPPAHCLWLSKAPFRHSDWHKLYLSCPVSQFPPRSCYCTTESVDMASMKVGDVCFGLKWKDKKQGIFYILYFFMFLLCVAAFHAFLKCWQ